jgi:hypothetical protein
MPVEENSEMRTEVAMAMNMGNQKQTISMKMRVNLTIPAK